MKVLDLKDLLENYPEDWDLEFDGLSFGRLKQKGEKIVNIEFNETIRLVEGMCRKCNDYSEELRGSSKDGFLCSECYSESIEALIQNLNTK